jgi:FtsP/CotA-like multicopper oxidase with cupredoxin domain
MSATITPSPPGGPERDAGTPGQPIDYVNAEALSDSGDERKRREWIMVGVGLTAVFAILAIVLSLAAIAQSSDTAASPTPAPSAGPSSAAGSAVVATSAAPTLAQAKGIAYERFRPVDPTLPAVPAGPVKKFTVSVIQHVVQVSPELAPVQAWSYTVNGVAYRGTAASPPIVVNQGDRVQLTFVNGTAKDGVDMAHSIDIHAAELAPNLNYVDVAPGERKVISFTAKYAGVFMYHCATQPVLMHTGAGMTGMFLVKPRHLPPAAKELWLVQGEYYIGKPGGLADEAKMQAETPDVIAFNGYANQYKFAPITTPVGKTIRLYVLNAGPSRWSAFHVIGTLFDTVDEEGVISHGAQTVNMAPAEGAWVDITLPQPGNYTFLTHAFGDMIRGAAGVLHTVGAPPPAGVPAAPTGGSDAPVLPSGTMPMAPSSSPATASAPAGAIATAMGDMWIRAAAASATAGKVAFTVANRGQMDHQFGIMRSPVRLTHGLLNPAAVLATPRS